MTAALWLAQTDVVLAFSWQDAAALGLALCAAGYIVAFAVRALYRKARGGCGTCGSRAGGTPSRPELVQIDTGPPPRLPPA